MDKQVDDETLVGEHPTWMQLQQFANGSLDANCTTWMESHISACDSCCKRLERIPESDLTSLLRRSSLTQPKLVLKLVAGYQILEEIGRGGMGVVYRAMQPSLNRQVAIKMIGHLSAASQHELSRFRLEAEACAALNHPNIAQVYDVGEIDGQPYIAMEFVPGRTLTDHLNKRPLEYGEATKLLMGLAQAMDHAHSCGIIHRDLKPSNVLMYDDGVPEANFSRLRPKIVDFGLAKRIDMSAGLTSSGKLLGTPSYMSPEQVLGDSNLIGPSTDVYSLGAILYESLLGRPPFTGATVLETIGQVQSAEPAKPSSLRIGFPKDLETICLKCLEKSSSNRYQTAHELFEDLNRFQSGRPILARPASIGRRAIQWSKRHPTMVTLMAISAMAALVVLSVGLAYNASLKNAVKVAETERSRANENFQVAFQSVERMLDRVGFAQLAETPEMEDVREKLLADAVAFYSELLDKHPNADIESRRQYYGAMSRLGRIQGALGQNASATQILQESIELTRRLSEENPSRFDIQHDLALAYINRGQVSNDRHDYSIAVELLKHIVADYPVCKGDLAQALNNLAVATTSIEEREKLHLQVLGLRLGLLNDSPDDDKTQYGLAETRHNLGFLYFTTGRHQAAESSYNEALQTFEQLVVDHNSVTDYHRALAECLFHKSSLMQSFGRTDEAIELIRRGNATRKLLASRFPKLPALREAVMRGLLNEAAFHIAVSQFELASQSAKEATDVAKKLHEEFPNRLYLYHEATCLTIWGTALSCLSDMASTQAVFERANNIYDDLLVSEPNNSDFQSEAGVHFMNFSNVLRAENPNLAASFNDRSVSLLESVYSKFPQRTDFQSYLFNAHGARAETYETLKNYGQAAIAWTRTLELAPEDRQFEIGLLKALALARSGDTTRTIEATNPLLEKKDLSGADLYNLACIYGLLCHSSQKGSNATEDADNLKSYCDSAFELLNQSAAIEFLREPQNYQQLLVDLDLEPIRASPLFEKLCARIASEH